MIIIFDWEGEEGGLDGGADHVGIVERVENGKVYTIEGTLTISTRSGAIQLDALKSLVTVCQHINYAAHW